MSSFLTESPLKTNPTGNQNLNEEVYTTEASTSRKIEFDRGNPLNFDFATNKISTIPYTPYGFFKFLWKNIGQSPFIILLLFVLLFYLISFLTSMHQVTHLKLHHSIAFHLCILVIEILLAVFEYIKIYLNDQKVNNQKAYIYSLEDKKFLEKRWKDIRVGNIIRVFKDEVVPADILILECLNHNHQCFLDYSSINGNFDQFVTKKSCADTHAPSMKSIKFNEYVKNVKGVLKYEEPNANMHVFNGRLKLENFPRASDITDENFIMRGSTIKNVPLIYGLVVYAGMDTKIMQTLKFSSTNNENQNAMSYRHSTSGEGDIAIIKKNRDIVGNVLKYIQYILIGLYLLLLFISFLIELHKSVLCFYSFRSPIGDDHTYLGFANIDDKNSNRKHSPFFEMFLSFVEFVLTFLLILPFNWFGPISIAYATLSKFIQCDVKVLLSPKNKVEVINESCIGDFGQVRHILTDKTGTLTSRKFHLKACSIHSKMYSFSSLDQSDENYVFRANDKNDMSNLEIYQEMNSNSKFAANIKEFIELLSLCHSVKMLKQHPLNSTQSKIKENKEYKEIPPNKEEDKKINFGSSFAEERAMLKAFSKLGYNITKTKGNYITLDIKNEHKLYYILGHNKYNEDRRRMSIIVRSEANQNNSILLCKAHDFSIFNLINKKDQETENEINKTIQQIKEMSKYGYRYFIFTKRILNEEETNNFITRYKSAENYVVKSEEHLQKLAVEFEKNLEFMGVLFFEEKIPADLKYNIIKLNRANIKVWIASGDKRENVLAVGKNLGIYNENTIKGDFSDKDKPEDLDIKMSMLLMQFLFPNEKINKMKTRKGVNVEAQSIKSSLKDLTILLSGTCFSRIVKDQRNFQSLATLLSYCTSLLAYNFTPNNKYVLCQMIKKYVSKNSKVLAVGDGFNDFMMLKEADLSIGIRSREILQVRNTCDVIVSKFSQIIDLVLVHGTWSYRRLMNIAQLSFYANFVIIFPMFLHQNSNAIGSSFYFLHPLKISLDILIINLFIIFVFCFDYPVERTLITLNSNVYRENFYDNVSIIFDFGLEFIRGGADSMILYYFFFALPIPVNKIGETCDQEVIANTLLYTSYLLIIGKIFGLRLSTINYAQILTLVITSGALVGFAFIGVDGTVKHSIVMGFSFFHVDFCSLLVFGICFLYEYLAVSILNFIGENFITKITKLFVKYIKDNLFIKNYQSMFTAIAKEMPNIISKVDKITYPEVLGKIYKENKKLDPALENMADVSNEEVANLKINKPFLRFYDKKLEEDFIQYNLKSINKSYLLYLLSLLALWIADVAIEKFSNGKVTKIIKLVYIILGCILFIPSLHKKFFYLFKYYLLIIITIEIVCVYAEKKDNDTKICIQAFFILSFPLYFSAKRLTVMLACTLYYAIGMAPAVYLNEFGFKEIKNQKYFLYSNLPLLYHRNWFIWGMIFLMVVYAYYSEIAARVEFLKFHKSEIELKKDNLIIANLIPAFVREKMMKGERGAALGYEVVTIVFCDIYDFDSLVAKLAPKDLIELLDDVYSILDQFCSLHGLQKIETVGKTYMAAGGIKECEVDMDKVTLMTNHAIRSFEFGVDILDLIQKWVLINGEKLKVKIGIHTGKVIPAVVGDHKPQFSLIGDTVNTTARMCSYSQENCINCSEFAYEEIKEKYKDFSQSTKEVKGKGMMNLYLYNPQKHKKGIDSKMKIPVDSSGNYVLKSITKKCEVLVKQGTKSSMRGQGNNLGGNMLKKMSTNKANDVSINTNKRGSFIDDSYLIVEESNDGLTGVTDQSRNNLGLNAVDLYDPYSNQRQRKPDGLPESIPCDNDFFANSKLCFFFKEDNMKNMFARFEKLKFRQSETKSIYINVSYFFIFLLGIYFMSQYAVISDEPISLFIALNAILLVCLIGVVYKTKTLITKYPDYLSFFNFIIFLGFTIINQVEVNKIGNEYYVNLAIEEILTIIAISTNGMLSYKLLTSTYGIYILIFIINACCNHNDHLVKKYDIFLIILSIVAEGANIMATYNSTRDFLVNEKQSKTLVDTEKKLFNLMPLHVVQNMKDDIPVADVLDTVTLLFADIVRFTDFSACHEPVEVVNMLSELFKRFDLSTKECSVYKVHTIGDCYVVMGFNGKVPMNERNYYEEAKNVCKMGENMIKIIREVRKKVNFEKLDMRIGIHTGPVIAGIIGSAVVRYDIFGSDVLIANKMESSGAPGKVNISEETKKLLETKEMPYTLTLNKVVQIPSVNKEIKCFFIDSDTK